MRPPEVFVRPLLHDEAVRLKRLSKRAKHQCTRQRAVVLLASNVRMTAPQIAEMWQTDASWVRKVIHEFNERGMNSMRPRYGHAVSAANLQHATGWVERQGVHCPPEPFGGLARNALHPALFVTESRGWSGRVVATWSGLVVEQLQGRLHAAGEELI